MALIHGAHGIIYFVHQFKPKFIEAALLEDPEMLAAVTTLNRQITELAPVLNSPTITNAVNVTASEPTVPVATMVKRVNGQSYLFAVAMRGQTTMAEFTLKESTNGKVEVLGEKRSLKITNGTFADHFAPWEVHLYRVESGPKS
jgi:hypothetical protein